MSSPQQGMSTQPSVGRFKDDTTASSPGGPAGSSQLLPKKPSMSTNAVGSKTSEMSQSGVQTLAPQSNHGVLNRGEQKPSDIVHLRSGSTKDKNR